MLWLVLGMGVVMAILSFAFYSMVREQNVKAHLIFFNQSAASYAESGINFAIDALRQQLADPASPVSKALLDAEPGDARALPMPAGWDDGLQKFLPAGESSTVAVSLSLEDVEPLWNEADRSQGFEPAEKTGTVVIEARASFRGMKQTAIERRPYKVLGPAMPVVSRFSLFVRNPDYTDQATLGYNAYANEINGAADPNVDSSSNVLPIVVYNHEGGSGTAGDAATHGHIFLGGDRDLTLNLTSGGDFRFGQYFHFYNFMSLDTSSPAAFLNSSPPTFFEQPHPFDGQQQKFSIKHAIYGYFTVDQDPANPSDMNRDGLLRLYFMSRTNMRSSTLHLFGSSLEPSPAKVFGRVYHSYPIYSAITVDVDGDGTRDGIVKMLPAVSEDQYVTLEQTDPIPTEIPRVTDPLATIALDPAAMHYANLFGSYDSYSQYMSLLVEREAYNTGVDYLKSRGEFPPHAQAFDPDADYPNPGDDVRLDSWKPGSAHFAGDLNRVDGSAFSRKAIVEVKDEAEFKARFLDGARLRLGGNVRLRQGDLTLPENLTVIAGGAILCPGTIAFDQVSAPDDQVLTLCSTGKDLNGAWGGKVQAHLIALEGQLGCTVKSRPLEVHGTVAVGRLPAREFPAGGKLLYDERTDPSKETSKAFLKAFLSDRAEAWDI